MIEKLDEILEENFHEMVSVRRYLHQHPELSFKEVETPKYIANYHRNLGSDVKEFVGGRGVVATLKGKLPGPTVALRADFDALPIQEENDLPYKSLVPGVMHACGHDGHTAQLLLLAKALHAIKDKLAGTVVFIHQHAEEYAPGGAIDMIKDGCLEGVDVIFGTHLWATEPLGKVQYNTGALMAAADRFEIVVKGKGGHGAQPHYTKDAILIGSQIVQSLQHIVSRRVDPLDSVVISFGAFEAKNAFNVIADTAKLEGTVRTFDEGVQNNVINYMKEVIDGIAQSYGATAQFNYYKGYPALINHHDEGELVKEVSLNTPSIKEVEYAKPQMGGEDFSYYLQHVKGAFFFTGAMAPDTVDPYPHHHPKFNFDEKAMLHAAKLLGRLTIKAFDEYKRG
ncbi:amidohydrolase [Evansella cellulosilytica]|uniref:Amidohydrolase n=1 Tax=Evansella cellulosilytica (strain ATCC 21833 / DSM 2522 / FERM P-1141 / JCM 9156 / N-4) TaxID=649639 RepID=E6TV55_EVAC2|nr:amidohydrolase [Evansella cellulosilytica]ADU29739.1 amidohydrolase [Evansella cellulosilytica DSM 2522]